MVYIPLNSVPEALRDSLAACLEKINAAEETNVMALREQEDALRKREDRVRKREAELMCAEREQPRGDEHENTPPAKKTKRGRTPKATGSTPNPYATVFARAGVGAEPSTSTAVPRMAVPPPPLDLAVPQRRQLTREPNLRELKAASAENGSASRDVGVNDRAVSMAPAAAADGKKGRAKKDKEGSPNDPQPPRRTSAYQMFRALKLRELGGLGLKPVAMFKRAAAGWKNVSAEEKAKWVEAAEAANREKGLEANGGRNNDDAVDAEI